MKKLPDEQTLLEILELAKDFEQSARELCELSTAIAWKYQKKVSQLQSDRSDSDAAEQTSLT
ncbi:hypothetical protein HC931_19790 [Candidatus Gracilibacteria bacterium]|nr:hypothetical protein [Candidatus Gracilibacteria bacterium]NJM86121.1 hypothetical protein [Hydrococcus sp. RU_2_2]NJP20473.1 hypothetical protein [Hydrococcus sp. CRU_1_1]NJQ96554.1 hypothetical protein [Hydrococcus sp. CSU_1_8]